MYTSACTNCICLYAYIHMLASAAAFRHHTTCAPALCHRYMYIYTYIHICMHTHMYVYTHMHTYIPYHMRARSLSQMSPLCHRCPQENTFCSKRTHSVVREHIPHARALFVTDVRLVSLNFIRLRAMTL